MSKNTNLSKFKPSNKNFEFQQYPFYWIIRLGNRYSHRMDTALKKVGMNISVWRVGLILRQQGAQSITEIATHAVSRLPTITKTVYKMQDNGLVEIRPREDDGRVSMVTITPAGLEAVEAVIANTTKVFDSAFEGLSEKQLQNLNDTLQTIFTNLSVD